MQKFNSILKKAVACIIAAAIFTSVLFVVPGWTEEYEAEAASVSAPSASVKSGTYEKSASLTVKLSCKTEGATIYYSINNDAYQKYTKALKISKNATLDIYAKKGKTSSKRVSYTYKLKPVASASVKEGTYTSTQKVKLSSKLKSVKMYYTLDGSKPTTKSTKYSSAIAISKTTTLRVLVKKSGWTDNYLTFKYTIETKKTEPETIVGKSILENFSQKYFYNTLDDSEKKIYKILYNDYYNYEKSRDFSSYKINYMDLYRIARYMYLENPQLFWIADIYSVDYQISSGNAMNWTYEYNMDRSARDRLLPSIEKTTDDIIAKAKNYTEIYDVIKYYHDTICELTDYETDTGALYRDRAGIDDVFFNGRGHCMAYSNAFAYLCQKSGIPAVSLCGEGVDRKQINSDATITTSNIENHAWNKFCYDGKWYNIDTTWDDTTGVWSPYSEYICPNDEIFNKTHKLNPMFDFSDLESKSLTLYAMNGKHGVTLYKNADTMFDDLVANIIEYVQGGFITTNICEMKPLYFKTSDVTAALLTMNIQENIFRSLNDNRLSTNAIKMIVWDIDELSSSISKLQVWVIY